MARLPKERWERRIPIDRGLWKLFLVNTSIALAYDAASPLFPLFLVSLGASILEVSWVLSLQSLVGTAFMIPSGLLADRVRKRDLVVLSLILAGIPPIIYTLIEDWVLIIPWAMAFNVAICLFFPARLVLVAERSQPTYGAWAYSFVNLSWPIGGLLGPAVAGLLAENYGWSYAFYFIASIPLLTIAPALSLREVSKRSSLAEATKAAREPVSPWAWRIPRSVKALYGIHFFVSLGFGTVGPLLPIYLTEAFNVGKVDVGLFYSALGIAMFVGQLLGGLLADRYGLGKAFASCQIPMPLLFLALPWAGGYHPLLALYASAYMLYSVTWPITMDFLMEIVPSTRRGFATGIRQTAIWLGFTVGPALGGYLWNTLGRDTPFYASAVALALCLALLRFLKKPEATSP